MTVLLDMASKKKSPKPKAEPRTVKAPRAVATMLKRAAVLRSQKVGKYAEPMLLKFCEKLTEGRDLGAPPRPKGEPVKDVTTLNVTEAVANRVAQIVGFNQTSAQVLLNDPVFRDAVQADYLEALRHAAAELGWALTRARR